MTAPYTWLITHDSIADPEYPIGSYCNARGVAGPHDADPELLRTLYRAANVGKDKWQGTPCQWFKMYDDDENLYYSGIFMQADGGFDNGFEPLDDFGTPNAGCTEIRYYDRETKEWDSL
jgi:hypothetical protein